MHRIFFFPRRCLHRGKRRPDNDFYVLTAKASRGTAAIHCRVAPAKDDDRFTDRFCVFKSDAPEPVDADMDICGTFLSAWNIELLTSWSACAYKDRIVVFF